MANIKSAKKRVLQIRRKTLVNNARRSRIKTFTRKVLEAVSENRIADAKLALRGAQSEIMRGVSKGVLHKNTGARRVSRLSAHVKKADLSQAASA